MVDHLGLLITAVTGAGNCGDRDGLDVLLYLSGEEEVFPKKIFANKSYHGTEFRKRLKQKYGVDLETVPKREKKKFILESRRWIFERTFAWFNNFRRLSKDYELITRTSTSMLYLSMTRIMLKRMITLR